ncbi:DUF4197 domain-containing protein [Thioalkalivibrio sulfidiphilus]|uniref:DUF4197 domain-containing protein n=1 Tax=Thioalkalivibrio sulfidiphilus TaxID=1033854 RepID=UPI001E398AE7|nr:DUF4197 domain-containing protein [Thioalkalivibrio sulfidiphilus]
MTRRRFLLTLLLAIPAGQAQANWWERGQQLLRGITGGSTTTSGLTQAEIIDGLREALRIGTDNVVSRLGAPGGFLNDPRVRIPLPYGLTRAQEQLSRIGLSGMLDDLEVRMNRAAEAATPRARALFVNAIRDMSIQDAQSILNGPDDAATRYFESRMREPLGTEMRPIVDETLSEAGAVRVHDDLMRRYRSIPFLPEVDTDLSGHVVGRALDGVFHYLAVEETAIRQDPARRTTELLRKVFGSGGLK